MKYALRTYLVFAATSIPVATSLSMQNSLDHESFNKLLHEFYALQIRHDHSGADSLLNKKHSQRRAPVASKTTKSTIQKPLLAKPLTIHQKLATLTPEIREQLKGLLLGASVTTLSAGALQALYYWQSNNLLGCLVTLTATGGLQYCYLKLHKLVEPQKSLIDQSSHLATHLVTALTKKPDIPATPTAQEMQAELLQTFWQTLDQKQMHLLPELALIHASRAPQLLLNQSEFIDSLDKQQSNLLTEILQLT